MLIRLADDGDDDDNDEEVKSCLYLFLADHSPHLQAAYSKFNSIITITSTTYSTTQLSIFCWLASELVQFDRVVSVFVYSVFCSSLYFFFLLLFFSLVVGNRVVSIMYV